jgi:hypothetical protein
MDFLVTILVFSVTYKFMDRIIRSFGFEHISLADSLRVALIEMIHILDSVRSSEDDLILWADGKYSFRSSLKNKPMGDYRIIRSHSPEWVDFMLNLDNDE